MKKSSLLLLFYMCWVIMHGLAVVKVSFGNFDIEVKINLSFEYNDNFFLKNEDYEPVERDFCVRFIPAFTLTREFTGHKLWAAAQVDYMKGITTHVASLNALLEGRLSMNFAGGLQINLWDRFHQIEQDWEISHEPGVVKSSSNHVGVEASHQWGNRLGAEAGYERGWEQYNEATYTTKAYLSSDRFRARLYFPVTWNAEGFGGYQYYQQYSDERDFWDYNENRYEAGVEWKSPHRFSIEALAGYAVIEYDRLELLRYEDIIGRLTLASTITDMTQGKVWIGINAYGKSEYGAELRRNNAEQNSTLIHLSKKTGHSYSPRSGDRLLETIRASLKHGMRIFWDGRLELEGGFLRQSSFIDSDYWFVNSRLQYPFKNWLNMGIYYHYRQRLSNDDRYDYTNNRIGCFFNLLYAFGTY